MSQLDIGLLLAVLNEHIALEESVLCLSGVAGSKRLDTMLIANPERDFPWFRKSNVEDAQDSIATRELVRVIDIAMRLSREGREGKPLGTIFVVGEPESLKKHLRQLVLNPCEGHPHRNTATFTTQSSSRRSVSSQHWTAHLWSTSVASSNRPEPIWTHRCQNQNFVPALEHGTPPLPRSREQRKQSPL